MGNRPAIPVEIRKEVLFEARHRCAVCCHPLTLEMAHIVPWHKTQNHSVENLIALCPNCHSLADKQNWGASYLKRYKAAPCAIVSNSLPPLSPTKQAVVDLIIAAEPDALNEKERLRLISMLAAYLDIRLDAIQLDSVIKHNSSRVRLRMPRRSAYRLRDGVFDGEQELIKMLSDFDILKIDVWSDDESQPTSESDEDLLIFIRDGQWRRINQPIIHGMTGNIVGHAMLYFVFEENRLYGAVQFNIHGLMKGNIKMHLLLYGERKQLIYRTPTLSSGLGEHMTQRSFEYDLETYIRYRTSDVNADIIYTAAL